MKREDTGEYVSRVKCSSGLNRDVSRREVREGNILNVVVGRTDARWLRRGRGFCREEVDMEGEETVGNSSEGKKVTVGSSSEVVNERRVGVEMDNRSEVGAMRWK